MEYDILANVFIANFVKVERKKKKPFTFIQRISYHNPSKKYFKDNYIILIWILCTNNDICIVNSINFSTKIIKDKKKLFSYSEFFYLILII